jgi:hypothetical protein
MKRITLALLALLLASPAAALNLSNVPPKFPIPWGNSAAAPYMTYPVPTASQIGVTNCAASLTDGFPPLTFVAPGSGGCAPFGKDYNGIFKQITLWNQWSGAGATVIWDTTYQTNISGYPRGAFLSQSANTGCFWVNTLDANSSNPDSGGANWTSACPGGGVGTGATTGSANAQTLTTTPLVQTTGAIIYFQAGFTNTSATTLTVNGTTKNVTRQTPTGLVAMQGGELQLNQWHTALYDGTQWELLNSPSTAYLTVTDQSLTGGAIVTSLGLTTGNVTIDCGARPLQYIANTGAFTITAPANDGSCMLQIENGGGGGGAVTAGAGQGWTINSSNVGDPLTNTANSKFVMSIWKVHGVASYIIKALQ